MGAKRAASPSHKRITLTHQSVRAAEALQGSQVMRRTHLACSSLEP
jgi:hypothetical protein